MARTIIDQDMIIKINNLYLELKTYAAVARELGISPSTVSKYVIKGYVPSQELEIIRFDYTSFRTLARGHLLISSDMSETLVLSPEEKEEISELWKELSL